MQYQSGLRRLLVAALLVAAFSFSSLAQTPEEEAIIRAAANAFTLYRAQRFAEAIPHFEIAIKAIPDVPAMRFAFGLALLGKSKQVSDTEEAKRLSARALEELVEAKRLGLNDPVVDGLIARLSGKPIAADPNQPTYSQNAEAEKAMNEAEAFFAQSKYDEAIKLYEKALSLDPTIYHAANAAGNSFVAKSDWEMAEKWYQRGIKIDPNRETAYRWSATPLMKQKKYDEARDRYIEAYIVEPYNRMAAGGMRQWAEVTGKNLGHPMVDVPELSFDAKGSATPKVSIASDDKNMAPWLAYITVRESWRKEKFGKAFSAKAYRHTLAEEAESLRAALKAAADQKSPNKQFDVLAKLEKEGLLEAFVLLSLSDQGIAEDHPEFLKTNRPKLRQYVANYLVQK